MLGKLWRGRSPRNLGALVRPFSQNASQILADCGLADTNPGVHNASGWSGSGDEIVSYSPATGERIGSVIGGTESDYEKCIADMEAVKRQWALTPAPARGQVVRKIGERLREKQQALGALISLENGKIFPEGVGEVQEAIDICDLAVGRSKALNGQVIPSERPGHVMLEMLNPLKGHVGIITAFNFPCAVAFWNTAISLICGNTQIWKGSSNTNLITAACHKIIVDVLEEEGYPAGIATMISGKGSLIGSKLAPDPRIELVSFTGSTHIGRGVAETVSGRFGKTILELGGNNSTVVCEDADMKMALSAALFGAVGTAGQRCTTLRRLYLHRSIHDDFLAKLVKKYGEIHIGDPLDSKTLCGPLITQAAVDDYVVGIEEIRASSAKILCGGNVLDRPGNFVEPTIVSTSHNQPFIPKELFAPVLYVIPFDDIDEAIAMNNDVPQGLSSSIFTKSQENMFKWIGPVGSDCGLVNVNIGTSGAEIGGAFGGEKETGGGRESGSDAWKQYMRRSTCTINYSPELPLAQGIKFGDDD